MAEKANEDPDCRERWNPPRDSQVMVPKFRVGGECYPTARTVARVNGNYVEFTDGKSQDSRYCFPSTPKGTAECLVVCERWAGHHRDFQWPPISDTRAKVALDEAA
jgi:hypothetical protein